MRTRDWKGNVAETVAPGSQLRGRQGSPTTQSSFSTQAPLGRTDGLRRTDACTFEGLTLSEFIYQAGVFNDRLPVSLPS